MHRSTETELNRTAGQGFEARFGYTRYDRYSGYSFSFTDTWPMPPPWFSSSMAISFDPASG